MDLVTCRADMVGETLSSLSSLLISSITSALFSSFEKVIWKHRAPPAPSVLPLVEREHSGWVLSFPMLYLIFYILTIKVYDLALCHKYFVFFKT